MKENNEHHEIGEETLRIPQDMSIDVLALIVKERLKLEIIQVIENRSLIVVVVYYNKKDNRHKKVIENARTMLEYYDDCRWSESENKDWKED